MIFRCFFLALLAFQLTGCADFARWARQYTYPSDFRYIEGDEVRATMRQLALHSRELNRLLRTSGAPEQHRGEIVAHLRAMEQATEKLDQSGWPSNHPSFDMNLPRFRRDIRFAREAVEHEPANFLLAGTSTGACVYCHGRAGE